MNQLLNKEVPFCLSVCLFANLLLSLTLSLSLPPIPLSLIFLRLIWDILLLVIPLTETWTQTVNLRISKSYADGKWESNLMFTMYMKTGTTNGCSFLQLLVFIIIIFFTIIIINCPVKKP